MLSNRQFNMLSWHFYLIFFNLLCVLVNWWFIDKEYVSLQIRSSENSYVFS